ncbi:MAG: hypothetical protein Q8O84_01925 [Nanoarchaeota archaeon]|nr:hypothetical protein [Nanoarchaeota archaeon]
MTNNLFNKKDSSLKIVKNILSIRKYKLIVILTGIVLFVVLYYFFVSAVANNNLKNSIIMDGNLYVGISLLGAFITSALSGIVLAMLFFKFNFYRNFSKRGIFGFIGSGISAFGFGCPTCGAFLFGLIGMPLALMYLPFRGIELQVLGIFILILSIYFTGKSINSSCNINIKKRR